MQPDSRAFSGAVLLVLVTLILSGCGSSATGYKPVTAHLNVTANGPGSVTLTSGASGGISCREGTVNPHCYVEAAISKGTLVTVTAVPDLGHEFVSWLKHPHSGWTDELDSNMNPVSIVLDGDYQFYANFR